MELSTQSKIRKNHYELFLLPNPLRIGGKKKSLKSKKYIDVPKICPICGNQNVVYSRKIKPTYFLCKQKYDYPDRNKLRIYFCNDHSRNDKKKEILLASVFLLLMTIIPFIIIINVYITFQLPFLAIILSGISFGIGLYGYIREIRKDRKYLQVIKKSFFFEVYCSVGTIISINCFKWAIELNKLNKCFKVKNINFEKLHDLDSLAMKYKKKMNYSALFVVMTYVIMGITFIIFIEFIDKYLHILSFIIIFIIISSLFLGKCFYEFLKQYPIGEKRFRIFQVFFRKIPI